MEMLKRGLPTVLLANENFLVAAKTMAKAFGGEKLVVTSFPTNMDTLPEDEIIALTRKGFEEIITKLEGGLR